MGINVRKLGNPGPVKKFDILSLLDEGYNGYLFEYNGVMGLNSGTVSVPWLFCQKGSIALSGIEIEYDAFPVGDLVIEYLNVLGSGKPVSSSEQVRVCAREAQSDSAGVMELNRPVVGTSCTPYQDNLGPCADADTISKSISPGVLLVGRSSNSSSNFGIRAGVYWSKTGATGSICAGSNVTLRARIFIKAAIDSGSIAAQSDVTITSL